MPLSERQELVLAALQAAYVHDFGMGYTHVSPSRVARAADMPYDATRRTLAQLLRLGLARRANPDEEWNVGRNLYYQPNWDTSGERDRTEWDERVHQDPEGYLFGVTTRLRGRR